MPSLLNQNDPTLRRHDLIFVSRAAWRSLVRRRDDLAGEPLVVEWVDRGWPLVARRPMPNEEGGLALGLPLPPSAGKRRIFVLMQPGDIISTSPPPRLKDAISVSPRTWRDTLTEVAGLSSRHGIEARIFGSLAWRMLTGLEYLAVGSDVDLLLTLPVASNVARLTAELAAIEAKAPMRLDGELVRDDGAAVNWRELHTGAREVLVKTAGGISFLDSNRFINGGRES